MSQHGTTENKKMSKINRHGTVIAMRPARGKAQHEKLQKGEKELPLFYTEPIFGLKNMILIGANL